MLKIIDSTPVDFVGWLSILLGELECSFLCDGVDNGLGTMWGTAAGGLGSVEPFTPLFNKIPIFDFVESKSLDGGAAPPFTALLGVD